ncbi:uncharacterized protein LOC128212359 [Mya arenaria]|uniref:uncharacterized protein LOC128212359 n=1 Tax=Mya arenaria TaxID=6604 RepID=UPI0022E173F0|nr:uncharacterized protein LOC128212359 [Mya arenaria]
MKKLLFFGCVLASLIGNVKTLFVDGCPIWGCRPSGSFSLYLKVPRENASISWISDLTLDPVPNPLGCVADSVNIVCLSNGPFKEDKGYVSLFVQNGTVHWRDRLLHFPTLPLLDNYGDVTGSDGRKLVHYDADGKTYPIIKCYGLVPMFSMQLVGTDFLLLVGEQGGLVVRLTNAIPVAEIFLNDTIQNTNGTFLPISQPVVSGQRFYLLTEFVPEVDSYDPTILNLQRLYAIDINNRPADIMTVAWSYNFEMEDDNFKFERANSKNKQSRTMKRKEHIQLITDNINSKQNVMWDYSSNSVFVTLPPPYMSLSKSRNTFWIFQDMNDTVARTFRSDSLHVTHMATFEPDTYMSPDTSGLNAYIWVSTAEGMLLKLEANGMVNQSIDLNKLLNTGVEVTTNIMLTREEDGSDDVIVIGVQCPSGTVANNYIIAVLNGGQGTSSLLWKLPVPNNMQPKGQLSASRGADLQIKDQIIFYAEESGKSARIISIH